MIPNACIASMIVTSLEDDALTDTSDASIPRTELDFHANMIVAGKHAYVLAQSGKTAGYPTNGNSDCGLRILVRMSLIRQIVHPGGTECAPCAYHGT
jgi:hypothetical protein